MLGPDLTYLINLGYGDGSLGYAVTPDSPADVPTPFGLFPDVSLSTVLSTLATDTQQGIRLDQRHGSHRVDGSLDPASSGQSFTDLLSALSADAANPAATFTDLVNATLECGFDGLLPVAADDGHHQLAGDQPARVGNLDFHGHFDEPVTALTRSVCRSRGPQRSARWRPGSRSPSCSDAATQVAADFSGLF